MINSYDNFKLERTLERYVFTDEITEKEFELYIENYIFEMNEGKFSEWKESMTQKLAVTLLKSWDLVKEVKKLGIKVIKKIMSISLVIIKFLGKWCDKNKIVCSSIIIFIIMITIGVVTSYAITNPTDPNISELANAALGFLDEFSNFNGVHESSIQTAKSILTQIRDGVDINWAGISEEANDIIINSMKTVNQIKDQHPDKYSELVDAGSKITSQFTYIVNGTKMN